MSINQPTFRPGVALHASSPLLDLLAVEISPASISICYVASILLLWFFAKEFSDRRCYYSTRRSIFNHNLDFCAAISSCCLNRTKPELSMPVPSTEAQEINSFSRSSIMSASYSTLASMEHSPPSATVITSPVTDLRYSCSWANSQSCARTDKVPLRFIDSYVFSTLMLGLRPMLQ